MLDEIQWGTAGEWAAAVGALALIAVTLWLWRNERHERERDEERRQSRAVNAWLDVADEWIVTVVNSGADPITDWSVSVEDDGGWFTVMSNRERGPLSPGRQLDVGLSERLRPSPGGTRPVQVTFIDAAGRRWWREGGDVKRV